MFGEWMNVPLLCTVEFNWKLLERWVLTYLWGSGREGFADPLKNEIIWFCISPEKCTHAHTKVYIHTRDSQDLYPSKNLQQNICELRDFSAKFHRSPLGLLQGVGMAAFPGLLELILLTVCSALLTWTKAQCEQLRRCFLIRLDHRVERPCGDSVPKGWPLGQAEKIKPKVDSLFWTLGWAVRCLSITAGNNQITVCESNFTDGNAKTYSNRCTFLIPRITIELRDTGCIWNIYLPLF